MIEKNSKIAIAVEKRYLPPGKVLLADASALTEGFQDALARIIQQQLGYQVRGKLRKEAKDLSEILLVGVSEGSGVLECETFTEADSDMPSPATIAAFEVTIQARRPGTNGSPTKTPSSAPSTFSPCLRTVEM